MAWNKLRQTMDKLFVNFSCREISQIENYDGFSSKIEQMSTECDTKGHEYDSFWEKRSKYWDWRCKRCKKHKCEHEYECCKKEGPVEHKYELYCKRCDKLCTKHNVGFCPEVPITDDDDWKQYVADNCEHEIDENGYCNVCYLWFGRHIYDENDVCKLCEEKRVCKHKIKSGVYICYCKYCGEDLCDFTENDEECRRCKTKSNCKSCSENRWTNRCDCCGEVMCDECTHHWEWNEIWCMKCYEEKIDQW